MLPALATAALAFGHPGGFGWPFFFLIPLFWIALVIVVIAIAGRRWRRHAWEGGYGYGPGGYVHPWAQAQAARSAEATLAERFAQGDIDEVEYRARVEVLRANTPQPPRR